MKNSLFIGLGFLGIFCIFFFLGTLELPLQQNFKSISTAHFFENEKTKEKVLPIEIKVDSQIVHQQDSVITEGNNKPEKVREVVTKGNGERVLLIGDSQCEGLKNVLSKYCEKNNHRLIGTVIYYSSSTKQFGTNDRLEEYIQAFKPSVVFFVIGLNEIFARDLSNRAKYIEKIKEVFKRNQVKYAWVGPAAWTKDRGIVNLMEKSVGDLFYPSHKLVLERSEDKRHPSRSASKIWFDQVARWADSMGIITFPNKVDSVSKRCTGQVIMLNALRDK